MLLARRSSNSFSYVPLDNVPCNVKANNPTTLPLITLTESLFSNNNTSNYETLEQQPRQRSRSINIVSSTTTSEQSSTTGSSASISSKYYRRAKTPSPKRSNHDFLNNKRKTPSPRSLSPKYTSSSRRSSNASICSSHKLDVGSSWEEFGEYRKLSGQWKTPSASQSPQRTLSNLQMESLELYVKTYNVALLGTERVGKKCLLSAFGSSDDTEEPTSPNLSTLIQQEGYDFRIKIINDPNALSHIYKYDGVILLYSITDRDSFKYIRGQVDKLNAVTSKTILLVGNKCDLERGRCVSVNELNSLANRHPTLKPMETSIQFNINIEELKELLFCQLEVKNAAAAHAQLVKSTLIEKLIKWGNRKWKSCVDIKGL